MSQYNSPQVRRAGGGVDVYTGLLVVTFLVLAAGVGLLAMKNIDHSTVSGGQGGVLTVVD